MSALYKMVYMGGGGAGAGVVAISKGTVLGLDVGELRYEGTYVETNGRLKLTATMEATAKGGGHLVTGQTLPYGHKLALSADWPADFANGSPQTIMVAGRPVQVRFEKIGDLP